MLDHGHGKIPYRFKDFSVCSLPSSSNQASKCAWTDGGFRVDEVEDILFGIE